MIERLILHAGTPKTGTTSLQLALQRCRTGLASHGIFVPPPTDPPTVELSGSPPLKPKHQFIVRCLRFEAGTQLRQQLAQALAPAPPEAHTAIFSTEGLYHHWWDFNEAAHAELAALTSVYRTEMWVWFRDPYSFFVSSYVQMLRNPVGMNPCYGRAWSPERMLDDPWFARQLDYAGFVRAAAGRLGSDALRLFPWRRRTVSDFFGALGRCDVGTEEPQEHRSPGALAVALLRQANAMAMERSARNRVVRWIAKVDAALGVASPRFDPGPATRQRLQALTAPGLAWLGREWGLCLEPALPGTARPGTR